MSIRELAENVYKDMNSPSVESDVKTVSSDVKTFDPATIMIIVQVISALITTFQNCKKPVVPTPTPVPLPKLAEEIKLKVANIGFSDRIAAKMVIRKEVGGGREYRHVNGDQMLESILNVGVGTDVDTLDSVINNEVV